LRFQFPSRKNRPSLFYFCLFEIQEKRRMQNQKSRDQLLFSQALDDVVEAFLYQPLKGIERSQIVYILRWMHECQQVPTVVELCQQIQEKGAHKLVAEAKLYDAIRCLQNAVMKGPRLALFDWAQILRRLSKNYIAIAFWSLGVNYRRGPQSRRKRTGTRTALVEQALDVGISDQDKIYEFIQREDASLLKGRHGRRMTPTSVMRQFKRQKPAKRLD
jgi:hypothetical protein